MSRKTIDRLIINSPFEEPKQHWHYDPATKSFSLVEGRRKAGYVVASEASKSYDDPGEFIEIPLVNQIRARVKEWREAGFPGVTGITRRLIEHWRDVELREDKRLFFCQLEAIETLIWLTEAPAGEGVGIDIPTDGGDFRRLCSKMATGSGKTIVMAMLIAWQILNKVTYPQDNRFSKNILVIAPGLTVKNRLQVLIPSGLNNYYQEFNIIPQGLFEKLRQGKVVIHNWHFLMWDSEEKIKKRRSVDKRGAKSNEAYVREVLGEMASASNIVVINDEAHHAWRIPPESKVRGLKKEDIEQATIWIGGLDRINRARGILCCYDFTATPFAPTGKKSTEETLYGWIVSDFGLNDAIECGIVKTPRVVIRDDAQLDKDMKSKLYHIYPHIKEDINRKAKDDEPLPDLVTQAYYLLGKDWAETANTWKEAGHDIPPVMISVANRTETAARIKYSFDHKEILIDELCDPKRTLHIDSKVLEEAEAKQESMTFDTSSNDSAEEDEPVKKLTKSELAEKLRLMVDTVGKKGLPGEQVQNVISVGMLSEGWDAKTVTHIMGLRAFSSQLLCEQVVGRGLRRTSYEINKDGLFDPEYVNIFGVPFTFLPHESVDGPPPPPPSPKRLVQPDPNKKEHEITWPNILRIEYVYRPSLEIDIDEVSKLEINAFSTPQLAELGPVLDGRPDITKKTTIDLIELGKKYRTQKIIFETAREVFDQMKPNWKGGKDILLVQLIKITEKFIKSDKIKIEPPSFDQDEFRKRITITLNMKQVMQHFWEAIKERNTEAVEIVFDNIMPARSTANMMTWHTGKKCESTTKSHINLCVLDSTWETSTKNELERHDSVISWAKNDHLGFEINYIYRGVVRKYRPDWLIKLKNGVTLILETKGEDMQIDKTKRKFLEEWVNAVNQHGGFGKWKWNVCFNPKELPSLIDKSAL